MSTETTTKLEIVVNGRAVRTEATTLYALMSEQGLAGTKVATAVNGRFVPEPARSSTALAAGDHVEIVSARQGG